MNTSNEKVAAMMHVMEFEPYAKAISDFNEIKSALDDLTAKHREAYERLTNVVKSPIEIPDDLSVALRLARGLPGNTNVDAFARLRQEEMEMRGFVSRLEKGLKDASVRVGTEQERGRAKAYRSRASGLAKIRNLWLQHVEGLLCAMAAEDEVLDDLVKGEFGQGEAIITRVHDCYIDRDHLRNALIDERQRVASLDF